MRQFNETKSGINTCARSVAFSPTSSTVGEKFMPCNDAIARFVRARLILSLALTGAATSAAYAQDADQQPQEVIVTGSRIPAPNLESTSPIQVVTAQEIQLGGRADISDVINQLPQVFNNSLGQDLGNRTSGLTTAGGISTADLRGLGPQRTLVLVNGRRLGIGSPYTAIQSPAPNLDQIPTFLLDRVDVVTGGASAVYGSDAIAATRTSTSSRVRTSRMARVTSPRISAIARPIRSRAPSATSAAASSR
jgi:outer membrane cobalamin receptor